MTDDEREKLVDSIVRIASEEIRGEKLDRKALRFRLRALARELGAAPPPDPRQLTIEGAH